MYFAKIFRTNFSKNLCFPSFLMTSSRILFPTMSSQVALSRVFRLALKTLCSTSITCIYWSVFFQVVCKDDFHFPFLRVYVTLQKAFSTKNFKKESAVIIVCSGLGKVYSIFYWKEIIGTSLINHSIDMELKKPKRYCFVDILKLLQPFSCA